MENFARRSILFEIINKQDPSEFVEAFTLTTPPDSIEIVQQQRINRTPTFGGVFEDDYGLGFGKITISGNTGNRDLKYTYIPGRGSPRMYSGKDAIYEFRNKIIRYKIAIESKGYENYQIRMYDLSAVDEQTFLQSDTDSEVRSNFLEAWIVSLDDFKVSRSKEKPLWYNYSIELFGISPLGIKANTKAQDLGEAIPSTTPDPDTLTNLNEEIGKFLVSVEKTKTAMKNAIAVLRRINNTVKNSISWAQNMVDQFDNLNKLFEDGSSQMESYISSSSSVISSGIDAYERMFQVAKFPTSIVKTMLLETKAVMRNVKDTVEDSDVLINIFGDNYLSLCQAANEAQRVAAQLVTFGKSKESTSEISVKVNGTETTIYGTTIYTASSSTTLAKLASEQYGDSDKSDLIATYNNIVDSDIYPGLQIQIPVITKSILNKQNKIYSSDKMSNFGADSKIDADGNIIFSEAGDFYIVSNEINLIQSVNIKLNEFLGKRLKLTTYGIKVAIGQSQSDASPIPYLLTNIIDTLIQDPRILQVNDVVLKGVSDSLHMSFNLMTIQGTVNYQGVI